MSSDFGSVADWAAVAAASFAGLAAFLQWRATQAQVQVAAFERQYAIFDHVTKAWRRFTQSFSYEDDPSNGQFVKDQQPSMLLLRAADEAQFVFPRSVVRAIKRLEARMMKTDPKLGGNIQNAPAAHAAYEDLKNLMTKRMKLPTAGTRNAFAWIDDFLDWIEGK